MHMQGKLLAFAAFFLVLPSCSADLVPTSISEQVSGSGDTFYCPHGLLDPSSCVSDSFGFAASNSQLGPYQVSKSGQATVPEREVTADAAIGQTSNVSAANLSVDMEARSQIDGSANHFRANTAVSNQFLFLFDLTSPAIVHLTGSVGNIAVNDTPNGSSSADAQLLFTGPGLHFERENCLFCGTLTFDEQFLLNPGTYTFSALTDGNIVSGNPFNGPAFSDAGLSVNADFTTVPETVPEPRWVAIPALLAAICCAVARRRYVGATDRT
jgi:hypothetical protein